MTDHADIAGNRARARALPMFNEGAIPPERDRTLASDDSGFLDVMRLLLRSWPYIRPQLLGHWWYPGPGGGVQSEVADMVSGEGYRFGYAPFLVAAVAAIGPMSGWMPSTFAWPLGLLYVPVVATVVSMFLMALTQGRSQMVGTVGVLLGCIGMNVTGGFFIEGFQSTIYAVVVTIACVVGWILQFRVREGQIQFRARVGTHLVYFYAINFLQRGIAIVVGLILADLLNQSLLQAEPLAPGLAQLLGYPELAAGSIEQLTDDERRTLTWSYVYVALGSYLLQMPLSIINPYYNMWIMQRINQDLRIALISRWHQLSLSYHSDHRTGDSIFRIYQDSAMVTAVVGHMIGMTLAMMSYYSCVVLVTILNPWLGLAAGVLVVPALLWAGWAMPRMRVRALVYREATSDVTSTIQESFSSIKLIKAFGTADRAQRRVEDDSVVAFNAAFRVKHLIALVTIVMYTVAAVFMAGGTSFMAWWAYNGEPTWFVELLALVGLSFVVWNLASFSWTRDQFHESSGDIRKLLRDWMTAQDLTMGLRRVFDILDIEPDVQDRPNAQAFGGLGREISFENVSFSYEPERPVLSDVSFSAAPGSITAIIGPTGSGKSTLMALLLRLFDADSGRITIDGRDLRDYRIASLRAAIAIALQENVLFAMSVRDNIRYVAPAASEDQIRTAIRVAAMDDYVDGLPNGLDTVLSDRGGKLSTGQRQRLSIARAVVRDTPILVLDEPTAALDAATEHRVMQNLAEWAGGADGRTGRAIFLITHRISTIRRADNILYLDGGRIVESGNHETLMRLEGGRYRGFVEAESTLTDTSRSLTA
ncbi:MAG: ABC transporter ATP-binding protein [Gammaproteobacteria bacterium]|nr:ABC transporter ATP-binding protein [Gammaproteobacteria bacterium]